MFDDSDDNNLCETKPNFKLELPRGNSNNYNLFLLNPLGRKNYKLVYCGSPSDCLAMIKMYKNSDIEFKF